jgi:hypothetical protein
MFCVEFLGVGLFLLQARYEFSQFYTNLRQLFEKMNKIQ